MPNEALGIPEDVREIVYVRDSLTCRFCGKYLGERAGIHHIEFGGDYVGMGGRRVHDPTKMVVICWLPGDPSRSARPCHDKVHADKQLWLPILLTAVSTPGATALQIRRWTA